ncbi:S8 family serine peptidase [Teredinibacter turnerae]|uniref:S8 family serine peptidase n=1 Tax=Teredinibacter turnerae TaxID=2426 RepID=UPI0030CEA63D
MNFAKRCRPIGLLFSSLLFAVPTFAATKSAETFSPAAAVSPLETRYIVKFKNSASTLSVAARTLAQESLLQANGAQIKTRLDRFNAVSVAVSDAGLAKLRSNPDIEYVELDQPRRLLSQSTPWGIGAVGADMISDAGAGDITVCIIDSGYDITTPDLAANNHTGTNDPGTGEWSTPGGSHGSHVAGTIAAVNNSEGVVGILPNTEVNLHIVKVFNASGWGYSSTLVSAIQTCEANNANVVNMSLGGALPTSTEERAMRDIAERGVLLVAAAGNDGNSGLSYPASYDSVLSVAAVDDNLDKAYFSQYNSQVELAAPGVSVLSTVGVGDGVESAITSTALVVPADRVVPHNRFIYIPGLGYVNEMLGGTVSGELAACDSSSGSYVCGDMTGKICVVERIGNESSGVYPDIDAVLACTGAGAESAIVYSNSELPGLQNPFLVDEDSEVSVPTVTVDRALGLEIAAAAGASVTLTTTLGTDYAFYDGTSMATPHVVGAAALVWSYFPDCGGASIREALTATAMDLGATGRDPEFGYGLVQVGPAVDYLTANGCEAPPAPAVITPIRAGTPITDLSAAAGETLYFSMRVPAGADPLSFTLSGGTGDADMVVARRRLPKAEFYDCASTTPGSNAEYCEFSDTPRAIWYVAVVATEAFSGVTLAADYTLAEDAPSFFKNPRDISIPDADPTGVISSVMSTYTGDASSLVVGVRLRHTYIADLVVTLIAPSGEEIVLHENTGGSADDIIARYDVPLPGVAAEGRWFLKVQDLVGFDTGFIDDWSLTFTP